MDNPLGLLWRRAQTERWCLKVPCTTCGNHQLVESLKELAATHGGETLAEALCHIQGDDLERMDWRLAIWRAYELLPSPEQRERVLWAYARRSDEGDALAGDILAMLAPLPGNRWLHQPWRLIARKPEPSRESAAQALLVQEERRRSERRAKHVEKALARARRHLLRVIEQARACRERAALLRELELMPPAERLRWIATHNRRCILYYPVSFAHVPEAALDSLDSSVKSALASQLRGIRFVPWRRLYARLLAQ